MSKFRVSILVYRKYNLRTYTCTRNRLWDSVSHWRYFFPTWSLGKIARFLAISVSFNVLCSLPSIWRLVPCVYISHSLLIRAISRSFLWAQLCIFNLGWRRGYMFFQQFSVCIRVPTCSTGHITRTKKLARNTFLNLKIIVSLRESLDQKSSTCNSWD